MMHFFHSLFSGTAENERYPEPLVRSAIERAVEGTDPWIRAVSGYRRKLRPAVLRAMEHVGSLVDGMTAPLGLEPASYSSDPRLRNFFISSADMRKVIENDHNLAAFRRSREGAVVPRINALLTMEKQEKTVLGAELSGNVILRDVPQVTVSFEEHQLVDPSENENKTRRRLKRRAFDYLLGLALKRIVLMKSERKDLQRRNEGLQSRLSLQQRGDGKRDAATSEDLHIADLREQLGWIERQLLELGREDRVLDGYLEIVRDVLNRPDEHLWTRKETLIVDRMGIKRNTSAGDEAPEVMLDVLQNVEGRSLVISLVTLSGETCLR